MEEQLLHSKEAKHRIMSIDMRLDEFDLQGNLTSIGKNSFWREVVHAMTKFDSGAIKLLPRKFQNQEKTKDVKALTNKNVQDRPRQPSSEFLRRIAEQFKERKPAAKKCLWPKNNPSRKSPRNSPKRTPHRRRSESRRSHDRRRSHSRSRRHHRHGHRCH